MALAATLDQDGYEALDEGLQGEYAESGGKWVLQVEGIKEHPTVSGLANAHDRMKRRNDDLTEKIKSFGDATPEDVERLQSELEALRDSGVDSDDDRVQELQEQVTALREKNKELQSEARRAKELEGDVEFFRTDQERRLKNEIRGALAEEGARPEAAPAAAALIQSEYNARYERDEKGFSPVVTGDLNGVPGDHGLTEFVSEWIKSDGAWALPASGKGGSGADPNTRSSSPSTKAGVKQVRMQGTTVRANPDEILSGKAEVVAE